MTRSHTISAAIVGIAGLIVQVLGLPVLPEEIDSFIALAVQLGSLMYIWYRRYTTGDVTLMGARRM